MCDLQLFLSFPNSAPFHFLDAGLSASSPHDKMTARPPLSRKPELGSVAYLTPQASE